MNSGLQFNSAPQQFENTTGKLHLLPPPLGFSRGTRFVERARVVGIESVSDQAQDSGVGLAPLL